MMKTADIRALLDIEKRARVTIDVMAFCGSHETWIERVYGIRRKYGRELLFSSLRGSHNQSGNPNYHDPVPVFYDAVLLEFLGVKKTIHGAFGARPDSRGDFISGFLFQLAGDDISAEQTGQGGELVVYELPLYRLSAFKRGLISLIRTLSDMEFITADPEEDEEAQHGAMDQV